MRNAQRATSFMVNFLVVTHGDFGAYAVEAAEGIVGEQRRGVRSVPIPARMSVEEAREKVRRAVAELADGDGLIILTDIPGGTPSNICLPMVRDRARVAVLSGLNLYMLVTAFSHRSLPFEDLTRLMLANASKSILDLVQLLAARTKGKI